MQDLCGLVEESAGVGRERGGHEIFDRSRRWSWWAVAGHFGWLIQEGIRYVGVFSGVLYLPFSEMVLLEHKTQYEFTLWGKWTFALWGLALGEVVTVCGWGTL